MVIKNCRCYNVAQRKPASIHAWTSAVNSSHGQEKFIRHGVIKSMGENRDGTIPLGIARAALCDETFLKDPGKLHDKTATDRGIG